MKNARVSLKSLALGSCALGALMAAAAPVSAEEFAVEAQSLQPALQQFASQGDQQVLFSSAAVAGKSTAGFTGEASPETALQQLLSGTDLVYSKTADGALLVMTQAEAQTRRPQFAQAAEAGGGSEVEALIVTAQKREEDIQDVPIAISAFTQEDLTRSQVAGGPDLMTQVPNMTFTKTNFSSYSIQLRGIGTQAISVAVDPAVAVAFNNTPFLRAHFFEQEFYDLERIEVLRGPQGTLYGRNATAGVVNILSAKPKFDFEAKLSADIANYNSKRLEGMINLPLIEDQLALRLAGAWTKRDGYTTNQNTGNPIDGRDLWSTRVSLRLDPNERLTANLIWEHFEEDDDRLRSGKQTCKRATTPDEIMGVPTEGTTSGHQDPRRNLNQGCLPTSFWSPEAYEVPDGATLPFFLALSQLGVPIAGGIGSTFDVYSGTTQSRDLRVIESDGDPEYRASADTFELNVDYDLTDDLTLSSQTGFSRDFIWSHQDFNRFNTRPGAFEYCDPATTFGCDIGGNSLNQLIPDPDGPRFNAEAPPELVGQPCDILTDSNCAVPGVFCDPQIGCSNRLVLEDLSVARSRQFSQELRLASNYDGAFNFSVGANYLRYKTVEKYYVFINMLTLALASDNVSGPFSAISSWVPGVSDNSDCLQQGFSYTVPTTGHNPQTNLCGYIDPNPLTDLNDEGHNYFLSTNPYNLTSYALFGEAYYSITPTLKLTAGLRWTVDDKSFTEIPSEVLVAGFGYPVTGEIHQEWREPTGRLVVDWKPDLAFTDETLVYGSYVHGYKAGGANPPGAALLTYNGGDIPFPTHPKTFEAEFVDAYEIGTKNTLFDGKLTLNLAGFYYDYTGYQISQIVDRSAVNLNFDAEVAGVELEADWRPLENLRFGLKVGYEDTRVADGMRAVDLMDRANGGLPDENGVTWMVIKPFVTQASNCILPTYVVAATIQHYRDSGQIALDMACGLAYSDAPNPATGYAHTDPATALPYVANPTVIFGGGPVTFPNYAGFDWTTAPNGGNGFDKDLGGNELPNAPRFTGTLTADYTLPLAGDWLMTLHGDFYQQSEAWTRIFNMPGYDKLKAFNNVNVAAIFTNEDAGWHVMAYVKNVFDKDNITGAFLNSDDTALTTNVFLSEPRLYGLRVTKTWSSSPWWTAPYKAGAHNPFSLELGGYYGPNSQDHEVLTLPRADLFPAELPVPLHAQEDLSWGSGGGIKLTYQPQPGGWRVGGSVRYGRAAASTKDYQQQAIEPSCFDFYGKYFCSDWTAGKLYIDGELYATGEENVYNYTETRTANEEDHTIVDFMVGKDFDLGGLESGIDFGLRFANFGSSSDAVLHGRPDFYMPDFFFFGGGHEHRLRAELEASREFQGVGPVVNWDNAMRLWGDDKDSGILDLELGLGGGVLYGKQKANVQGETRDAYMTRGGNGTFYHITPPIDVTISRDESKSVSVPTASANIGLSYTLGGLKVSGGYRAERYYKVIDGGLAERKTFDRDINGAYVKLSFNFGG
jgi:iron complex outermembrane receptor protein